MNIHTAYFFIGMLFEKMHVHFIDKASKALRRFEHRPIDGMINRKHMMNTDELVLKSFTSPRRILKFAHVNVIHFRAIHSNINRRQQKTLAKALKRTFDSNKYTEIC